MTRILAFALAALPLLASAALAGTDIGDPPPGVVIPEPASLALLAIGAGAVLVARARRK